MEMELLPYVVFLLVPVLGAMSDQEKKIRDRVARSFAKLVALMPLEAGVPDPDGLSPSLSTKRLQERHFIEQLLDGRKIDDYPIPVKINAELRKYQKEGVNWLGFLNKFKLHGILCDDMGLGKTLQAICILASDDHYRKIDYATSGNLASVPLPSLVVCPTTLVGHWYYEVQKFCTEGIY
jgi:TATA-binding protein-associated factor